VEACRETTNRNPRHGAHGLRTFLKKGHETSVWNRTKSKCEPLAALGAQVATSVQDAVAAAEIIVVNDYVTSDTLLRKDDATKALRGTLLLQLTSGSPRQAREMAVSAERNGIHYLDGAIMATLNKFMR
jgi:3-hydroxyisobutyrate dehydrogenase-like beta-hydroxyacid dehydrogenase